MTDLFLGVDAGNTKTDAIVVAADGTVLGRARGGLGDIYGVDAEEEAVGEVLAVVERALAAAGEGTLRAAAFLLAGVDWPEDERLWRDALRARFGDALPLTVANDGFALLRWADDDGVGVAVSLGTGAAIAGRGPAGEEFAVSWWFQHGLGAAGLGDDALRAIYLAELGMAAPTTLSRTLPALYAAASPAELLRSATRRGGEPLGHHRKALAAPAVTTAAAAGDAVAGRILHEHAERVAGYVEACARRVGLEPPFTVTLGGTVAEVDGVRASLLAALARRLPGVAVVPASAEPVLGAALDALRLGGVAPTAELRTRLADSRHG